MCVKVLCVFACLAEFASITTGETWNADDPFRNGFESEGTVLNRMKRQISDGLCILPPYPNHGTYIVANQPNAVPGQSMEHFVMTVVCRRGYGFVETGSDTKKLHCSSGDWSEDMPECVRFCKLNADPSISYICHVPGQRLKACDSYVSPGTTASVTCRPQYYSANGVKSLTCKEFGVWSNVASCKAECGRVTPQAELLLIGGKFATFGELPWHVAVYDKTYLPYEQICGGSIVSNNVVISAAHCFWSDVNRLLPAFNYAVATGKLYRPWHDDRDSLSVQKSDLRQIKVPRLFQGAAANFQQDIAILVLTTPFTYKAYIRPVCYDFNAEFDQWQLKNDNLGKVAGWGLISANGDSSTDLKVVQMPFVDERTCLRTIPSSFREYITGDKFCAGYVNGTAVCKGDSGGGLVFADVEHTIERYYLRGVVSASPKSDDDKLCNDLSYTAFTKITKHQKFITETMAEFTPKTCSWYLFQCDDGTCLDLGAECNGVEDCPDGSDEAYHLCTPGATTTTEAPLAECILPPYPDHGTYEVGNDPEALPGQASDSFALIVTCDSGYGVRSDGVIDGTGTLEVYCFNGDWLPSVPECVQSCKLDRSPRMSYKCINPETRELGECDDYLIDGTSVVPVCLSQYKSYDLLKNMTCLAGEWNYIAECYTDCGEIIPESEQLEVIKEKNGVKLGEAPWYVAVYSQRSYGVQRDGTLLSNNVVLTSGIDLRNTTLHYNVAVGKLFGNWNYKGDASFSQKSLVKEIKMPDFDDSIALLIVGRPFFFNDYVKPVCVNFNNDYYKLQGRVGKMAMHIGDGQPNNDDNPVGYVSRNERKFEGDLEKCLTAFSINYADSIGNPEFKMCTEYPVTGLAFLQNYGAGLVFSQTESGVQRYYLRGVLIDIWGVDEVHNIYVFAKMFKYREFINKYI